MHRAELGTVGRTLHSTNPEENLVSASSILQEKVPDYSHPLHDFGDTIGDIYTLYDRE